MGSVIGLLMCGPLIKAFGWPSVFYLFGVLGIMWCLAWPLLKADQVGEAALPHVHDGGLV